jgi:hypothetical protein
MDDMNVEDEHSVINTLQATRIIISDSHKSLGHLVSTKEPG